MNITARTITLTLFISFVLMILWGQINLPKARKNIAAENSTSDPYASKEFDQGNVTVVVKPISLSADLPPQFDVVFDTHTEELDFDVEKISKLMDDLGNEYGKANWNGTPAGGHHRKGVLTFDRVLNSAAGSVTLTFNEIAGIPVRSFSWEVSR